MSGLLITGTSSDAGKSLVVTGLCRVLARRGLSVAPYKAQNMSNHSMVCRDGSEIGRAQYLQAQAAGVEATSAMNPVLLKPGSDRRAHVVVRGRPAGQLRAGEYTTGRQHLADAAFAAYEELSADHDVVVCEGAGSPAEINLRAGDYVNLGLAQSFSMPTVLVGDIDRGGVLAALYGTWALVSDEDRPLLAAYVINKFRGDASVLEPGLAEITRRTGMPSLGVLPWLEDVWLDSEDGLSVGAWGDGDVGGTADQHLTVAVVRLPRTSNATDVDALAAEPGVDVRVTRDVDTAREADLLVLPGSRATVSDLAWLRRSGLADVVVERARRGAPVLGICGGYQMLADEIVDGVEGEGGVLRRDEGASKGGEHPSPAAVPGLGLLPGRVDFREEKVLARPSGGWHGHPVEGYEIHHGVVTPTGGEDFPGGHAVGPVRGSIWHGTLECDDFRHALLTDVATTTGSGWRAPAGGTPFAARRERMVDTLANALEAHVDVDALLAMVGETP
ncbi:cobyric acid synthase [Janibacter cremeus]|uniref:cobyric acid synthase n=1 Tax=Janibacter cremeus TaxID=1285192 RepID=UPI0023F71F7C|nr:cobyric acid synthase [Janibacter cremeus]WEV78557.1 cobyric acid synthase [Janibacter cremeus]